MKKKWLENFVVVANSNSLTEAAEKLYISPPGLSSLIKRMENELGVELFDRRGKTMVLTDTGKTYLPYVEQALLALDAGERAIKEITRKEQQTLVIATTTSLILQPIIIDFKEKHPEIVIASVFLGLDALEDDTLLRNYDFLLSAPEDFKPKPHHETLDIYEDDQPVLLVAKSHPLALKDDIDLIEVKDEAFVALYKNYSSRLFFDRLCKAAGFKPRIVLECDYNMRRYMVAKKMGITIGTTRTLIAEPSDELVGIPIVNPSLKRRQTFFWRKGVSQKTSAKVFLSFLRSYNE